ncbi:MAG: HAD-IC family P-type ATPase [Gemmatimonadaceae bacterium]|nr:HAD-IC family P-type ATPase [Gemmatimonadaceae bacterium]
MPNRDPSPTLATPTGAPRAAPEAPWHVRSAEEVARALGTGPDGLPTRIAEQRFREMGPNEVEAERGTPWWVLALGQLRDPLIYILLVAAGVTLALGDVTDAGVILVVVGLNGVIGFVQELRARRAMRALAQLSAPHAQVVRDGEAREVPSRELVPGDVVRLTSGSLVPADLRLVEARDLALDESLLTGESIVVEKTDAPLADPGLVAPDQRNMAFAGTTVVHGRGEGIVVRTGAATELGRIAYVMRGVGRSTTPLQETFARLGRWTGVVVLALATVVVAIGVIRGRPLADVFLTAVALAVSAVPEGLPVVLTVTLAIGVRRMARRKAIIRALPAVETLGSTTVIGSDKTGTLTRNEMTVRAVWTGGRRYEVTGAGYAVEGRVEHDGRPVRAAEAPALRETLRTGVLASEVDMRAIEAGRAAGDPTEVALVIAAMKAGMAPAELDERHEEVDLLPFESERGFMISLRREENGLVERLKGAPEVVLSRCDRQLGPDGREEPLDRDAALAKATTFAGTGLRVLAIAFRSTNAPRIVEHPLDTGFVFAGLVGIEDPVRPEAVTAVAAVQGAGVRVLMLTGDHADTARSVGQRLALGDAVVTGREIDRLSDDALDRALERVRIFARVTPEHKLRIVQRLKARHEVVAVTGDGVNDAPALRAAHLGIAMGARGSDVAREASDMILADDNFATIAAAVEEGRIVFANIRKVTFFLLSTAASEILAVLGTLIIGWPLPFTAAQILWINLVTDSLEVMALSFEPGEPGLLRQPPRPRDEGVLTRPLFVRVAGVGLVLVVATLAMFWWTLHATGDMRLARTVAVTQMVVLQFYHVFNCRSLDRSVFRIPLFSNRFLFVSMVAVTLAHLAALYVPFLQRVLRTTALSAAQWGVILLVGLVVIVGGELDKAINRRAHRRLG